MTVLTTDATEIVLPRDAFVEVRDPSGEFIGYYKLEPLPPDDARWEAIQPSSHPDREGGPGGAPTPS